MHDVEWLSDALAEHCTEDVARMLGCAPQSVRYAARKYGVAAMVNGHDLSPQIAAKLADREWLAARRTDGVTVHQLADELGISPGRVSAAIRAAGLPPVRRNGSKPTFPQLYDRQWIRTQLATKTKTQVARDLGCSVRSVRDAARRAGVPTKTQSLERGGGIGRASMIVDFGAARRQIERQSQFPGSTRRSAFAAYVGLFDLADEHGRVEVPSAQLAAALDTTRTSWLSFRRVLVAAGLLSVGPFRGSGRPVVMQLHAPADGD